MLKNKMGMGMADMVAFREIVLMALVLIFSEMEQSMKGRSRTNCLMAAAW